VAKVVRRVLVPADHLVERAGEEGGGERARDVDGVGEVVGCRAGVDLVEEPHPLLGEGERADRFLLKRRRTRSQGLSGQRAGGSFRQGSHDPTASHGGGPAGYCPPPSRWRDTPQRLRPAQVESAVRSRDLQVLNLTLSRGLPARLPIRQTGCRINLREERRSCALKSAFPGLTLSGLRVHSAMPSVGYALGAPASACISPRELAPPAFEKRRISRC
jgi:hypothetical protein